MTMRVVKAATCVLVCITPISCATGTAAAPVQDSCAQSTSAGRFVPVRGVAALRRALARARPGDRISLAPGHYGSPFVINRAGTGDRPIQLCGPSTAVIDPGNPRRDYGLELDGANWWVVRGLTITDAQKGVVVDRSQHVQLTGTHVHDVGDEGVHLRSGSTDIVLRGLRIWRTGRVDPQFGEGVYVGSAKRHWCEFSECGPDRVDRVRVEDSSFGPDVTAEAVDVKEGTSDGIIDGDTFDGSGTTAATAWVNIKGNGWQVLRNTGRDAPRDGVQVHVVVAGWGRDILVKGNDLSVDAAGYGIRLDSRSTGVTVACDNVVRGAQAGFSNVGCSRVS